MYSNNSVLNSISPFIHYPIFLLSFTAKLFKRVVYTCHLYVCSSFCPSSPQQKLILVRLPETSIFSIPRAKFSALLFDKLITPSFWKHCLHSASSTPLFLDSSPTLLISLHFLLLVSLHSLDF